MEEVNLKQIRGLKKTISSLVEQKNQLQVRIHQLEKDLGLLDSEGFVERVSLPPIKVGAGLNGTPICWKHGALLQYEHNIWRCETCKTSVDLSESLNWIREEFDGVVVIQ